MKIKYDLKNVFFFSRARCTLQNPNYIEVSSALTFKRSVCDYVMIVNFDFQIFHSFFVVFVDQTKSYDSIRSGFIKSSCFSHYINALLVSLAIHRPYLHYSD